MDQLSLCTAPIELFADDGPSCGKTASGFFIRRDEKNVFFATNWHVVTGRDPTRPNLAPLGVKLPCVARLKLHTLVKNKPGMLSLVHKSECRVKLNNADGEQPEWLNIPTMREKADVVVLMLDRAELDENVIYTTIADCQLSPEYQEAVMDDVFVVGYPSGLSGGDGVLPLYKRGSIASEPAIDQQRLPRFLINCRTAEGMSGSPVICSHSGIWSPDEILE